MLSPGAQYQRMQQNYLQRPTSHPERFQYLQQYKPISMQRPPNMGHELLTKLEQAGKVPSREKFRRMCCQVIFPYNLHFEQDRFFIIFAKVVICS